MHERATVCCWCMQVFGLDSLTGAIVWQYLLPGMKPFQHKSVGAGEDSMQSVMPLFVQRTTAHFPHQPVCTVVGTDQVRSRLKSPVYYLLCVT